MCQINLLLGIIIWIVFISVFQLNVFCIGNVSTNQLDSKFFLQHFGSNFSKENYYRSNFLPDYVRFQEDVVNNDSIQPECRNAFVTVLSGLDEGQYWAVALFNSWAKFPPSGLLQGTMVDFGDYDQCVWHQANSMETKYCLVDIAFPMKSPTPRGHNLFNQEKVLSPNFGRNTTKNINIQLNGSIYEYFAKNAATLRYVFMQIGVCLPGKCSSQDAQQVLKHTITALGLQIKTITCNTNADYWNFNTIQLVAIAFLLSICLISFIATIYENFKSSFPEGNLKKKLNYLIWFSPLENVRKLIHAKSEDDDLACVHGIRVFTMIWIVIGHGLDWNQMNSFRDTFIIKDRASVFATQPLFRALLSVDTFFFLSGMLTSYINLKYTKGKFKNFSTWKYLLLRYLRLTPQLACWMLLTFLLPAIFDGPLWKRYIAMLEPCYHNWWLNLVYAQNLVDVTNICGLHTLYLAADMQLHWIALIPIMVSLKSRTVGRYLIGVLMFCCVLISSITLFVRQFPPGSVSTSKSDIFDENGRATEFLQFVYYPWTHVIVFFIGVLFGEVLKYKQNCLKQITYDKTTTSLLWFTAVLCYAFSIYSVYPYVLGLPYQPHWSAILFPLNLLFWSLGMCLTIWLCVTQNGGYIGDILSSRTLRPFSRMTYSVYLTHVWVVWIVVGTRRSLIDLRVHSVVLLFATLLTFSYVVGFVFSVLIESPVIRGVNCFKHKLIAQNRKRDNSIINNAMAQ